MKPLRSNPVAALAQIELSRLSASPLAYLLLSGFYLCLGLLFIVLLDGLSEQALQLAAQAQQGGSPPPAADLPATLMEGLGRALGHLLLFLVPLLAMGFFAQEGRTGVLELLLTSPLTPAHLAAGKFLAGGLFLLLALIPASVLFLLIAVVSSPPLPLTVGLLASAGLFLVAGAMLSLALFSASLTDSRLVAAVLSFVLLSALWLPPSLPVLQNGPLAQVLRFASVSWHFNDFARGVFDTRHLIYYLSLCGLGLALTSLSLASRRWRN